MNEQASTSEVVPTGDGNPYDSPAHSDVVADTLSVDASGTCETPRCGTVAVVDLVEEKIVHEGREGETTAHGAPIGTNAGASAPLLDLEESRRFRSHWIEIQGQFVDEPRSAVQQADALVSEVIEQITQIFAKEHSSLESQWKQGDDVSTEDLRKALQHYRSFFNRLVV
jgi:hypothetical protein